MHINSNDYAWIAGFFDGEGCLSMSFSPTATSYQNRGQHRLTISLTQNDRAPLDWVSSIFGGRVRAYSGRKSHQWHLTGLDKQRAFLYAVLPYLRVKKRQAELAIEFLGTVTSNHGRIGKPLRLTDEIILQRERIVGDAIELKK